jgi:hypothetical protein
MMSFRHRLKSRRPTAYGAARSADQGCESADGPIRTAASWPRLGLELRGLELRTLTWAMAPFEVNEVASSFFDDALHFSQGKATFDSALVMRAIEHEWLGCAPLCCAA